MKKIVSLFILISFLFANIEFNRNIRVLNSLGISSSFINNSKLNRMYKLVYRKRNVYFINALKNGIEIYPIIKAAVDKSNLPKELVSVVLAESFMKINAYSRKRAVGIWQFMPYTARRYGLKIDDYVDERRDVYKSTQAAVEYLEHLHKVFGKWYLALMAYNAGEARVVEGVVRAKVDKLCTSLGKKCKTDKTIKRYRRIIKAYQKYGARKFGSLYKLYKRLSNVEISLNDLLKFQPKLKRQYIPKETRNYILKIISISFLFNKEDLAEYAREQLLKAFEYDFYTKVKVPGGTSLYYISQLLGIDYKTLKKHNPHLKYSFTPPYKYYVYIPAKHLEYFYANFDPHKRKYIYVYRVKRGDNIAKIAKKFGVPVKMIYSYNKLGKYLHIGEKIFIPMTTAFIKYKVKKRDSLYLIAKRFGISYKKIMKINNLRSSILRVGQILKIPQKI